mgnify:FL=1
MRTTWEKFTTSNLSASVPFFLCLLPKQKYKIQNYLSVSSEETTDGGKEMVKGILEDVVESAVKGSKSSEIK